MARPIRIEYPGAIYHVTSRGNAQSDIYLNDKDRKSFLKLIEEVCTRFNWCCYAYCLMTNHYHLVLETAEGNLSKGMRHLNGVYTQRFNQYHRRVGHVFQGRYKAIIVEKESYLLEVVRYVILNPVRAHMTKTAGQYPWSSYRAMIGKATCPGWLHKDWVLRQFGKRKSVAQKRFIEYVKDGSKKIKLWDNLRYQIYLGEEHFVKRIQSYIEYDKDLSEIPRLQRRHVSMTLKYYAEKFSDKEAMQKAYETGNYTLKEIADYFNVHYSTVSRAINLNY